MTGKSGIEFAHPDDIPLISLALTKLAKDKETSFEWRCMKKDGEYIWIQNNIRYIRIDEKDTEFMVFDSHDINKRKELEKKIWKPV